ncbi:hypothetical protein HGRIS_004409 [Hohenbuehelia grisea]|uniref:C2H2-type domain-containing protein n=1 Tax=Hohenbuehelia grisea TaxID=104357 RepID=A0ABR3JCY3_9AGAR
MPFFSNARGFSVQHLEATEVHGNRTETTHVVNHFYAPCVVEQPPSLPDPSLRSNAARSSRTARTPHPRPNAPTADSHSFLGVASMRFSVSGTRMAADGTQIHNHATDSNPSLLGALLKMEAAINMKSLTSILLQRELELLRITIIFLDEASSTLGNGPLVPILDKLYRNTTTDLDRLRSAIQRVETDPPRLLQRVQRVIYRLLRVFSPETRNILEKCQHSRTLAQSVLAAVVFCLTNPRLSTLAADKSDAIQRFICRLNIGIPKLQHIKLHMLTLIDHLGRNLVIPMEFCSSWETFQGLFEEYCRTSIGGEFVVRGAYQVIKASNEQVLIPASFVDEVVPDMILELSIILRPPGVIGVPGFRRNFCPRCGYMSSLQCNNQWMECHRCATRFSYHEFVEPEGDTSSTDSNDRANFSTFKWNFRRVTVEYQDDKVNLADGSHRSNPGLYRASAPSLLRRKIQHKYQCEFCGGVFTAKHNLQYHLRAHNPIPSCKCHLCGALFTTRSDLRRHQKSSSPCREFLE